MTKIIILLPLLLTLISSISLVQVTGEQCTVDTLNHSDDIFQAFQAATCDEITIYVSRDSICSFELDGRGQHKSLFISGNGTQSVNSSINLKGFESVEIFGLFFQGMQSSTALSFRDSIIPGGIVIENCTFSNNLYGGISNENSMLEVKSCLFINNTNTDGDGGAIYSPYSNDIIVTFSTFIGNFVGDLDQLSLNRIGGAIRGNVVHLFQCHFENNTANFGGAVGCGIIYSDSCHYERNNGLIGGGIYTGPSNMISNSTFVENTASSGGALYCEKATVSNCSFISNIGSTRGGAVYASSANIYNSKFHSNVAMRYGGGAIGFSFYESFQRNRVYIYSSEFIDNESFTYGSNLEGEGGAIIHEFVEVHNSSFVNNRAGSHGGAISSLFLFLNSSTFVENVAADGGGAIYVRSQIYYGEGQICTSVIVEGSSFVSNMARLGEGGAIHSPTCYFNLKNSKFTNNTAMRGGAFRGRIIDTFGSNFTLNNCIQEGLAIYADESINIIDSRFENNFGTENGGVYSLVSVSSSNSHFIGNSAKNGAGIYSLIINVVGGSFVGNYGSGGGGGIYGVNGVKVSGTLFENNSAINSGGAIYSPTVLEADSILMRNNTAKNGSGGGICFGGFGGQFSVINSIFTSNKAQLDGGGISLISSESNTNPFLRNITSDSNVAENNGGFISIVTAFTLLNISNWRANRDKSGGSGGSLSILSSSETGKIVLEDTFTSNCSAPLGGGWFVAGKINQFIVTQSDWEDNYSTEFSGGAVAIRLNTDQVLLENCTMNRNIANFQGSSIVLQDTSNIRNFSLRNLNILDNNSTAGGTVTLRGTIGKFTVDDSLVSGNQGSGFEIDGSISYFIVNRSNFTDNKGDTGSSISAKSRKEVNLRMEISESNFERNKATGNGGAIWIGQSVDASIIRTDFVSNSGLEGGGVYLEVSILESTVLSNCSFRDNYASTQGGSISVKFFGQFPSMEFAEGNTFIGNKAGDSGGAVSISRSLLSSSKRSTSPIILQSSYFSNNIAFGNGGAMSVITGDLLLKDCDLESNSATGKGNGVSMQNGTLISENSLYISSLIYLSPTSNFIGTPESISSLSCGLGQEISSSNGIYHCINSTIESTAAQKQIEFIDRPINTALIVGISVGVGGFLILIIIIVGILLYKRQQRAKLQANSFSMIDFTQINMGEAKKSVIDFDSIKVMKEIGAGAFGVVYKAEWRGLTVAVKQIKSENVTEVQLKDFLHEVAILKGLRSHPNVVLFLGITFPPQPLSLITEFCEGGGLYEHLRNNQVTQDEKLKLIVNIAKGMLHLHHEGVIHRDLAVRNILLSQYNEPKVSDFGLSREHSDSESAATTTTTIGPLKWMSPEAITKREYSVKSDVFSFGVVVWEILEVEDPWSGMGPVDAALRVARDGERLKIPEGADPVLANLMMQCWEHSPDDRPNFVAICALFSTGHSSFEEFKKLDMEAVQDENHYKSLVTQYDQTTSPSIPYGQVSI